MEENVNHPSHYNSHPSGIECIDVIRDMPADIAFAMKYLWRTGLKHDASMDDTSKAVEDCEKAIWYINDYINNVLLR